jgi:hypothetical protein
MKISKSISSHKKLRSRPAPFCIFSFNCLRLLQIPKKFCEYQPRDKSLSLFSEQEKLVSKFLC